MASISERVLASPAAMTLASVLARAGSVLLVLPLVLTRLSAEEVAVWYLLMSVVGLQTIADLGFAPTFTRVIAYAMGGSAELGDLRESRAYGDGVPRWDVIEKIWGTMHSVYARLALFCTPAFIAIGAVSLQKSFGQLATPMVGWLSLGTVSLTFAVVVRSNAYGAYLQGVNEVALLRRWETLFAVLATVSSALVLLLGGRLGALVFVNQGWLILGALRDRVLARNVVAGRARSFVLHGADREVLKAVWGSAVRSGIGIAMSRGVLISSGLILAQFTAAGLLASFLLANRVQVLIVDLANAPFYSRLPHLARLRSEGRYKELEAAAGSGMRRTYWVFTFAALGAAVLASPVLRFIGSSVGWVPPGLWALIVAAAFVERFGAVHLQLYSLTNDIVWHVANGVSGCIYLLSSLLLLPMYEIYAFPIGALAGYLLFYGWYAPLKVARSFPISFWPYQARTVMAPGAVLLIYFIGVSLLS